MKSPLHPWRPAAWRHFLGLGIITLLVPATRAGTTYFVDANHTSASDANAGSATQPFKSIQQAADVATAGDTVYVRAGTYENFRIKHSGNAAAGFITFSAAPGDERKAVIDAINGGSSGIYSKGHSYLEIRGFSIVNCKGAGIWIEGSEDGNRGIRLLGNRIHNTSNAGIMVAGLIMGQTIGVDEYRLADILIEDNDISLTNEPSGGNECISVGGGVNGVIVRRNWVHDSDQYGIDFKFGVINGEISGNHIHNMEKHGIYLDTNSRTLRNIRIFGNRIHDNLNGIVLARESARQPQVPNLSNVHVYNNVIYRNRKYGLQAYKHPRDNETGLFSDIRIYNNTFVRNGLEGVRFVGIGKYATDFVLANNILFENKIEINDEVHSLQSGNLVGKDPQFRDAAGDDYRLKATSPAIDATDPRFVARSDFDGRPLPPEAIRDVGAYEFFK